MASTQTTIYLEAYIESTMTMPAELQRVLNTIKALDEKCQNLSQELQVNVSALLQMPPQYQQPEGPSQEYEELNGKVAADQKLLLQFAEEKVQLAQQAHDLLEVHALELERVTDDLDKELRKNNPEAGLDYLNEFQFDNPRGKTPRLDDYAMGLGEPQPSLMGAPSVALPKKGSQLGAAAANKGKRPRDDDVPFQLKKKVSMPPAPLATQPSYEEYGIDGIGGYEEPGPTEAPPPFLRPPPAGYKASSARPQAQSCGAETHYLTAADIRDTLIGRHAELFWPADNLWYLVEIQGIEVETKEASVLYSTGDFETLNLEETAANMHMVLVPEHMY